MRFARVSGRREPIIPRLLSNASLSGSGGVEGKLSPGVVTVENGRERRDEKVQFGWKEWHCIRLECVPSSKDDVVLAPGWDSR